MLNSKCRKLPAAFSDVKFSGESLGRRNRGNGGRQREEEGIYHTLVMWATGDLLEGQWWETLPDANSWEKKHFTGHWFQSRILLQRGRGQDKALKGVFPYAFAPMFSAISLNIQYGYEQHGLTDHVQTADIYKSILKVKARKWVLR